MVISENERNLPDPQRDNVADNLFRHLLYLIATGKWPGGMRLPSIRAAEKLFGASRTSVQQAYQSLVTHQLVESKPRSGYIVKVQSGDDWILRHRSELRRLYESFSQTIIRSTGLAPLPALRYLTRLADILDHEHPSCAFIECTSLQAEGHAREIRDRLGISVVPMTVGDVAGKRLKLPSRMRFAITTHFHHAEISPLRARRGLEILAVPIEVSPSLQSQVELLKGPIVLLETERQMALDISDDARGLVSRLPISTMAVDSVPAALHEILGKGHLHRHRGTTVLLSPRDWGFLDEKWRKHPRVQVISFSICESAWDSIAEFLGMPIGPLG